MLKDSSTTLISGSPQQLGGAPMAIASVASVPLVNLRPDDISADAYYGHQNQFTP